MAKNKELEVTKVKLFLDLFKHAFCIVWHGSSKASFIHLFVFLQEEKEKARAQKEEVVTQVTEVLENELQCIVCSELFIEVQLRVGLAFAILICSILSPHTNPLFWLESNNF